jgi:hypothetical protein
VRKSEAVRTIPFARQEPCQGPATRIRFTIPAAFCNLRAQGRDGGLNAQPGMKNYTFAAKIRSDRGGPSQRNPYHVGRPGEDGYVTRVLQTWGSMATTRTNVAHRQQGVGYVWSGGDRHRLIMPTPSSSRCCHRIWRLVTT